MAYSYPEEYEAQPPRRGRRPLVVLVVVLLVLGGLFVVADRAAAAYAERAVGDQVRQEVAQQKVQSSNPEVTVGGFPFLTQVAAGRYESISILLRNVRGNVNGNGISLPELHVDARNVKASIQTLRTGQGEVIAETVKGTGTITYASLAELINRPGLTLAEQNGKLAVKAPLDVFGQRFTVTGTGNLTVSKGQVQIRFDELTAEGLPQATLAHNLISQFAQQISINVPLPHLPFKLDVQQVRPRPEGLEVTATAKNVPLRSAG